MTETPIETAILDEARGAHGVSRKILSLVEESDGDPIAAIVAMLQMIQDSQRTILTRLGSIERRLASPE